MSAPPPGRDHETVAIPVSFFEHELPEIHDLAELKVMLTIHRLLAQSAYPGEMVPEAALYGDEDLRRGLRWAGVTAPPLDDIRRGIELAVARDALLRFRVERANGSEAWLMLATPENRRRLHQLQRGDIAFPAEPAMPSEGVRIIAERPNVFRLYEQNIGIVTPLIADQLIEALELYPEQWLEEAMAEAVGYNRRSWRYVQRILERWASEGRGHETDHRHSGDAGSLDPEKYLRGKYAALFRRDR